MNTTVDVVLPLTWRARLLRYGAKLLLQPIFIGPLTPAQRRTRLDRLGKLMSPLMPRGTQLTQQPLGGVPCDWIENSRAGVQGYMLYLHGGGFVIGSPLSHRNLIAHLARRCALRVAAPDYRLAPEHAYPAAVDDALAAYRGLLDMGVAAQDIVIAGDSAGGNLALACALAARDAGLPLPSALVVFSPWADLTNSAPSIARNTPTEYVLGAERLSEYAGLYLKGTDPRSPLASPAFADYTGMPPLLVQVSDNEILHDDALKVADAARRAGVEVVLQSSPELWHVWQAFAGQAPEADWAIARVARFVAQHLGHARA